MIRFLRWLRHGDSVYHFRCLGRWFGEEWLFRAEAHQHIHWGIGADVSVWHPGVSVHLGRFQVAAVLMGAGDDGWSECQWGDGDE